MGSKQTRHHRNGPLDVEILRTGVLLSLHANPRHLPAGADPLPVGVPSDIGAANVEGAVEAFARQDHVHNRVYPINRLAGIIATFATFDTDPTTPANMTDGNFATETGEGIKALAGAGTIGDIYFDLGAVYPVLLLAWLNYHRASGDGTLAYSWLSSTDGITWYNAPNSSSASFADIYKACLAGFAYARYIGLRIVTVTAPTGASVFHVKVAEAQALQLI